MEYYDAPIKKEELFVRRRCVFVEGSHCYRRSNTTYGRLDAELLGEVGLGDEAKEIRLRFSGADRGGYAGLLGGSKGGGRAGKGSEDSDLHHR